MKYFAGLIKVKLGPDLSVNLVFGNRANIAKAKSPVKAREFKYEVGSPPHKFGR